MAGCGMEYDDLAAYFLIPPATPVPAPAVPATPARRLRDALEPVATIGWWSREASESAGALGLDFFSAYVWGRAAGLGADVAPLVVASAFGVFEPGMIGTVLTSARATASHQAILQARQAGAAGGLAAATETAIEVSTVTALGQRLLAALADLDGAGRPLFSGLRSLAVPSDPLGRLWRAAELVREHRGDGHLAASVAAGLDAVEMNVLTELWLNYPLGEYSATRGFSAELLAQGARSLQGRGWLDADQVLTTAGSGARDSIERATDASQAGLIAALGDDLEAVIASASQVSAAVLDAHAAPADARKRAAG
jgi:hypothetical protein